MKKVIIIFITGLFLISLNVFAQDDVSIDSSGNVRTGVSNTYANLEVTGASDESGIYGVTSGMTSVGVLGINTSYGDYGMLGMNGYGVFGYSLGGLAAYFVGNAQVTGTLTVGGGLLGYTETDPTVNALGKASLFCSSGQVAKWIGSIWACAADNDTNTTYSAGAGLNLAGTTFNVNVPLSLSGSVASGGILSGTNSNTSGYGVYGGATGSSGRGVYGVGSGSSGVGVYGFATAYGAVTNYGGSFTAYGDSGVGVYGSSTGQSGRGVFGLGNGGSGVGVYGVGGQYDFYAAGYGTNYGPFTGAHEVRLSTDFPSDIKPGMVVSVTGKVQKRLKEHGSLSFSSTLPTVMLSSVENDKAVFGVLISEGPLPEDHWYKAAPSERFGVVNALGEGRVWVSSINGNITAGDYITTSVIPGYGQRQEDDLLHSYTLGKAIETVDWDAVTESVQYNGQIIKIYPIAVVYTSG